MGNNEITWKQVSAHLSQGSLVSGGPLVQRFRLGTRVSHPQTSESSDNWPCSHWSTLTSCSFVGGLQHQTTRRNCHTIVFTPLISRYAVFTLTSTYSCQIQQKYQPCRQSITWAAASLNHEHRHRCHRSPSAAGPALLQIGTTEHTVTTTVVQRNAKPYCKLIVIAPINTSQSFSSFCIAHATSRLT